MTKQLTHLHIETGPAGWLRALWRRDGGKDNVAFVQFQAPRKKGDTWKIMGLKASKDSRPAWLSSSLIDDVPRYRIEQAVAASADFQRWLLDRINDEPPADLDAAFRGIYKDAPRHKLKRPRRGQFDEDFLREVAIAYRQAVAAGLPPLKTMAEDAGIPQGTIARWVAKARSDDFKLLPPAEPGKVTT